MGGEIHITKLASAGRQLHAAIRMFFSGEDELAIHTVASAAYHVITDLKDFRGRDESADYFLRGVFYTVRDYRAGTLPSYMTDDPEKMRSWRKLAETFSSITASSKWEDFKFRNSPDNRRAFWRWRRKVANFLKHGDRSGSSHISMEDVDNLTLLMAAQTAYVELRGADTSPETWVLNLYHSVNAEMTEDLVGYPSELVAELEDLSCSERLDRCSALLNELRVVAEPDSDSGPIL